MLCFLLRQGISMRVVKTTQIGDRRVQLLVTPDGAFAILIEVIGPDQAWHDISMLADARLRAGEAERRYQRRVQEQHRTWAAPAVER